MNALPCFPVLLSLPVILMVLTGCEIESASENDVAISPSTVTLRKGQSQEFVASGGYEYTWSLGTDPWGTLTTTKGNRTVYTSLKDSPSNDVETVKTLTVTSTLTPAATNASAVGYTAEALVRHSPAKAASSQPAAVSITAAPSLITANGGMSVIEVTGGRLPYRYAVADAARGSLLAGNEKGSPRTYQRTASGDNVVTVSDSDGRSDSVVISQP